MAKVKKAQFGSLIRAASKAASKAAPKVAKAAKKVVETPAAKPKLTLREQDAQRALRKSIEKRTNPPKKLSYEDEIWKSYQRNGGVTKSKSVKKKK